MGFYGFIYVFAGHFGMHFPFQVTPRHMEQPSIVVFVQPPRHIG